MKLKEAMKHMIEGYGFVRKEWKRANPWIAIKKHGQDGDIVDYGFVLRSPDSEKDYHPSKADLRADDWVPMDWGLETVIWNWKNTGRL